MSSVSSVVESPDENWVLKDVSFEVKPGERVGIVGATGSGKTTLINLLLRFYDVKRGRITVDGVDVRDLDLAELRGLFSLVLQDVHLFSGTIADNIRLGNQSIDDEPDAGRRRSGACRRLHRAPAGRLREPRRRARVRRCRSARSSCCRSRAPWRSIPRVLILDEATSSVDTETELLIRDALRVLMAGRTTIAIAHRLSTIQDMDKILVLHKGRLRESGTHQELLAARGIYFRLFELQYKGSRAGRRGATVRLKRRCAVGQASGSLRPCHTPAGLKTGPYGGLGLRVGLGLEQRRVRNGGLLRNDRLGRNRLRQWPGLERRRRRRASA